MPYCCSIDVKHWAGLNMGKWRVRMGPSRHPCRRALVVEMTLPIHIVRLVVVVMVVLLLLLLMLVVRSMQTVAAMSKCHIVSNQC